MDKKFIDAINAKDFISLRDKLKNRLLMDHDVNGGMFNECWAECEKAGIIQDIFQKHDGRPMSNKVTENNYNTLVGQLSTNFSEARLNKILFLAKQLWPSVQSVKIETPKITTTSLSYSTSQSDGEERILSERIISEKEIVSDNNHNSSERMDSFRGSDSKRDQNMNSESKRGDSGIGVAVAVAAVAVTAIIVGVAIFG